LKVEDLLFHLGLTTSKGEAKRMIEQGGAEIDGTRISDPNQIIQPTTGMLIKVGKRKLLKIKATT
jgi:tyrosyl-tRNA synthetase